MTNADFLLAALRIRFDPSAAETVRAGASALEGGWEALCATVQDERAGPLLGVRSSRKARLRSAVGRGDAAAELSGERPEQRAALPRARRRLARARRRRPAGGRPQGRGARRYGVRQRGGAADVRRRPAG